MLRRMSAREFLDWMAFDALEPIGDRRGDYQAASIVAMMVNLRRGQGQSVVPVEEFLLEWKSKDKAVRDQKEAANNAPPRTGRSWQEMKLIGQMWAEIYNSEEEKRQQRNKRSRRAKADG